MSIYEKLLKIQTELAVTKDKFNSFGEFKYRSCEDILQALKPFLKELNCVILLNDELANAGDKNYIKATATLVDVENKESVSAIAYAQEPPKAKPKMDESQTSGSTSSYARKYALNGLLALDDNVDSDTTNKGDKVEKTEKLITKTQIQELKKLGFNDERLSKMAAYYKVDTIEKITYKQADEAIKKQTKQNNSGKGAK